MSYANSINRLILGRAMGRNRLVQFGIPRSGSTLVYNVLREAFPATYVKKTHSLDAKLLNHPIIATYRNPLDVMASLLECQALEVTYSQIRDQLISLNRQGLWDVLSLRGKPNVLLLQYERFFDDFDFLFDSIEFFLKSPIGVDVRRRLKETYSLTNVKARIGYNQDFSKYDKLTKLHGKHISRFNGQPGYHTDFFSGDQVTSLRRYLSFFLEEMGYE